MIAPNELSSSDDYNIDDIIAEIDAEIAENHHWYHMCDFAILTKEYPKSIRDEIAQKYRDVGWNFVEHRTSSESGERPGLTEFRFSKYPISW
jgi:hypothetical protein